MAMDSQIINRMMSSTVSSLNDTHLVFDTCRHITPIFFEKAKIAEKNKKNLCNLLIPTTYSYVVTMHIDTGVSSSSISRYPIRLIGS